MMKKEEASFQLSLPTVPQSEIAQRLARVQQHMQAEQMEGLLITHKMNLLYFAGSMQNGTLFIPATGEATFYVKKSLLRAEAESSLTVEKMGSLRDLGKRIETKYGSIQRLGIEEDVIPYKLAVRYIQSFDQAEMIPAAALLRKIRAQKSPFELDLIKQSAAKVDRVIQALPHIIRPQMSELELVAEIEYRLRLEGNFNLYRTHGYNQELVLGMVAAGRQATVPTFFDGPAGGLGLSVAHPQSASREAIQPQQPILIDIGATTEGYLIDQTRIAVIGELTEQMQEAYQVAKQILRHVEPLIRPGVSWEQPYLDAIAMAKEAGLADHFMGYGADQVKFLGHGIGLEIDEWPVLAKGFTQPLQEGMVIAIEPKFLFPGQGIVGIENTYVVQTDGLSPLTQSSEEIIRI
jgi:Xaa-Pro aminopeptidase